MTLRPEDLTDGTDPMTFAEIAYLRRLAAWLPPAGLAVNIGADRGISTIAFLERSTAVIFSIDVLPCQTEIENVRAAGQDPARVIRLLGRSQAIGEYFPWPVDLVLVDGDHSERGVRGDIHAWVPRLKPGGVVAFHDYMEHPPANNPSGAYAAVNDLIIDHPQRTLVHLGTVDRLIAFLAPATEVRP